MKAHSHFVLLSAFSALVMLTTSCTPTQEGAFVGGAIGTAAGGALTDSGTGALVGGLLGAAVGAAIADDRSYRRPYYGSGRGHYNRGYNRGGYCPPGGHYGPYRGRGFGY